MTARLEILRGDAITDRERHYSRPRQGVTKPRYLILRLLPFYALRFYWLQDYRFQ